MSSYGGWKPPHDDEFRERIDDLSRRFGPSFRRWVRIVPAAIVLVIAGATSYFQVEPDEVGILTRFGAYAGTAEPGPHFKIPFWIDRVDRVPVQRQLKQEFGFRTVAANVRTEYGHDEDTQGEATMLTGDLNVANVEWIIQYKINHPYKFLFRVRNPEETLRDMSEAAMRQAVGDHSVTEVLTIGREAIQIAAKDVLQDLCDRYDNGIQIQQLVLQDVNPPEPVQASFNEVNEAIQEKERAINEAEAEYNQVIPEARGGALRALQVADGYNAERVNRARGDAQRFLAVQTEYAKAPAVTRTRLYLETMTKVLPQAERRVVVDDNLRGVLPLLSLDGARGVP